MGRFLVVEQPLEPSSAILVLGGSTPYREMEGAELYRAGWAPKVVLVSALRTGNTNRLMRELGVIPPDPLDLRRQVLDKLGVPPEAIVVAPGEADATLDELELALKVMPDEGKPVILVSSNYHTRRVRVYWDYVGGGRRAIVRPAPRDPFDPEGWWRTQATMLNVVRELLGLTNYLLGFPIAQRASA